jgi:hypothetical protein
MPRNDFLKGEIKEGRKQERKRYEQATYSTHTGMLCALRDGMG